MNYGLVLKTGPASEPVTLDQAKLHLNVDFADQDALITAFITAAREQAEAFTSRCFLPQTWWMYLDGFPGACLGDYYSGHWHSLEAFLIQAISGQIQIPRAPVISVDSIQYTDTLGNLQFLDPSLYQVDPQFDDRPVRIVPAYSKVWPATRVQPNSVIVQFQAGYADASHVPQTINLAMNQAIADWYENREAIVLGSNNTPFQLPNSAKALLWAFRLP